MPVSRRGNQIAAVAAAVLLCGGRGGGGPASTDAFQPPPASSMLSSSGGVPPATTTAMARSMHRFSRRTSCSSRRSSTLTAAERDVTEEEEEDDDDDDDSSDTLLFSDDWEDGVPPPEEGEEGRGRDQTAPWQKNARWNSLNPHTKKRIIEEAQQRAVRNKKKREPIADKKRKMMFYMKKKQREKEFASRVARPKPFDDRAPLSEIAVGEELPGVVISLTNFGAYVDVGTEVDGLLHVSQITRDVFVQHPREVLAPGDEVTVRVTRTSPEMKKLQLTMLGPDEERGGGADGGDPDDDESTEEPILLDELALDDELWGEIRRVTAYGSYVELGAEVDGFLHFMDHPEFGRVQGAPPSEYMKVGDRVRVWVSDVDREKVRIKLTANRPPGLPGPRREMRR